MVRGERRAHQAARRGRRQRCVGEAGRGPRRSPEHRLRLRLYPPAQGATRRTRSDDCRRTVARLSNSRGYDPAVTRWRLTIEYDGKPFMGWQRQEHGPSVQQTLEEALQRMTGEQAQFIAAGRTDAGVHALAMSAHVDVERELTPHRLREGLNALVRPHPISVLEVEPVADDWHARFSCTGRRYLYRILNRRAPAALDRGRVWHIPVALDVDAMGEGAAL